MMKLETKASLQLKDIQNLLYSEVDRSAHLSSDTRLLGAGDVFLAYPVGSGKGLSDNRIHIPQALELGVSLVLYEKENWSENEHVNAREKLGDPRCIAVPQLASLASEIADWWYGHPSKDLNMIGVTGTNGKTTVSHWISQALGKSSAVFGTLGYGAIGNLSTTGFTTPDAARVQRVLGELKSQSYKHVAMEVSSHALEQGRVNSVLFKTAIFTNLSQDHLDYHGDMQEYARAKYELFCFPSLEKVVLNMDDPTGRAWIEKLSKTSKAEIWVYGSETSLRQLSSQEKLKTVVVQHVEATQHGMKFDCQVQGQLVSLQVECIGQFNVDNMMAVLATLLANGMPLETAITAIKHLKPVDGRLEMINLNDNAHPLMVVDFAHTPDALEKVLVALRPIATARGGQLVCVFGCGGNRDKSKRPLMGKLASQLADRVIITSDNPRAENPEDILADIQQGIDQEDQSKVTTAIDRAFAILTSVKQSLPNDVVLVAGKGHERVQEIAGKQFQFSDQDHIRLAIRGVM